MVNYSNVFADVLAEFESNYVPGDQGDAGKGQATARAGERINRTLDANVGYIGKNPGQTQFNGIAVDALQDKSDGYGADYLTDILQADGRRLIALAFTPYPTPAVPPTTGWVQPTPAYLDFPGPMVLKSATPPGPEPAPTPPADTAAILDAIAGLASTLDDMRAQAASDTAAIIARDDANTAKSQQQISDLVEDVEQSLKKAGIALVIRKRRKGDAAP